jgi:hypothetical protein
MQLSDDDDDAIAVASALKEMSTLERTKNGVLDS